MWRNILKRLSIFFDWAVWLLIKIQRRSGLNADEFYITGFWRKRNFSRLPGRSVLAGSSKGMYVCTLRVLNIEILNVVYCRQRGRVIVSTSLRSILGKFWVWIKFWYYLAAVNLWLFTFRCLGPVSRAKVSILLPVGSTAPLLWRRWFDWFFPNPRFGEFNRTRKDLLFLSQMAPIRGGRIRPQQFYHGVTFVDVWSLWVLNFRVNRIIFSYLYRLEVNYRHRVRNWSFSVHGNFKRTAGTSQLYRQVLFRKFIKNKLAPKRLGFILSFGAYRYNRITHRFTRRHMVVRRYTHQILRVLNGGHGLKHQQKIPGPTPLSMLHLVRFPWTRLHRFLFVSYYHTCRWTRHFDGTSRPDLLKFNDLNRLTNRFRFGRFKQNNPDDYPASRPLKYNIDFIPINLIKHWWEYSYEHPYFLKPPKNYWWSYQYEFKKRDFPIKTALFRHRVWLFLIDKVSDFIFPFKFFKYYDEQHMTYSIGKVRLFKVMGLRLWEFEADWDRREVPGFFGTPFDLYIAARQFKDIAAWEVLFKMHNDYYSGSRLWTTRKFWMYFNRFQRYGLRFHRKRRLRHGWFTTATPARTHWRGLGARPSGRFLNNFFVRKYARLGRFYIWGHNFIDQFYTKERMKTMPKKESGLMEPIERHFGLRKRIFFRDPLRNLSTAFNRFFMWKSGFYNTSQYITGYSRYKFTVYTMLRCRFHMKWQRKSYINRNSAVTGVTGSLRPVKFRFSANLLMYYPSLVRRMTRHICLIRFNRIDRFHERMHYMLWWRIRHIERTRTRAYFKPTWRGDFIINFYNIFQIKREPDPLRGYIANIQPKFDEWRIPLEFGPHWFSHFDGATGTYRRGAYYHPFWRFSEALHMVVKKDKRFQRFEYKVDWFRLHTLTAWRGRAALRHL